MEEGLRGRGCQCRVCVGWGSRGSRGGRGGRGKREGGERDGKDMVGLRREMMMG